MKNSKRILFATVPLLLSLYVSPAMAVGAVSRACQYASIPEGLRPLADTFFLAVGGAKNLITAIGNQSNPDKNIWILESLTTDYFRGRYYLYAVSDHYVSEGRFYHALDGTPIRSDSWRSIRTMSSPGWGSQEISPDMQSSKYFHVFYANRGVFTSQRAGNPDIEEDMSKYYDRNDPYSHEFAVMGQHYAYDPVAKHTYHFADTAAFDCNLNNLGTADYGLFDR